MWICVYLVVAAIIFVATLAIGLWDTITLDKYVKEAFGYDSGACATIKDCIWDFVIAFVAGGLWPLFLIVFVIGGVEWRRN